MSLSSVSFEVTEALLPSICFASRIGWLGPSDRWSDHGRKEAAAKVVREIEDDFGFLKGKQGAGSCRAREGGDLGSAVASWR